MSLVNTCPRYLQERSTREEFSGAPHHCTPTTQQVSWKKKKKGLRRSSHAPTSDHVDACQHREELKRVGNRAGSRRVVENRGVRVVENHKPGIMDVAHVEEARGVLYALCTRHVGDVNENLCTREVVVAVVVVVVG
mgnify:CR=1 FL=1